MKFVLNFILVVSVITFLTSCSNDIVVINNPPGELFEYSVLDIPITSASHISAGDENTLFVAAVNGGWKITNGNAEKIDFQHTDFRTYYVEADGSNYAVFSGTTGIPGTNNFFKIYDNGTVRAVSAPENSNPYFHLLQKNEFISALGNKYIFFKDSSFTEYSLPEGQYLYTAGRINNENYLVADDGTGTGYTYRHTPSGPVELFEGVRGVIFNSENNFFSAQALDGNRYMLYYFAEKEGWEKIYVSNLTDYEHPRKIIGSSINFLAEVGEDEINGSECILIKIWDGNSFKKQTNFPHYIFPSSGINSSMISQYKNNCFFLYKNMGDGGRIIKAKIKTN